MDRDNHYEAAFEAYLRHHHIGYIGVDETRRCELDAESVKNVDFLVMSPDGSRLLVDVKGRRFPGGPPDRPRKVWQNWSTREDVEGLIRWAEKLGPNATGLLVFVYHLLPCVMVPPDTPDFWCWRGKQYLLRAAEVGGYSRRMRTRSPRWGTVGLLKKDFRELVRPFRAFTSEAELAPVTGLKQ